MVGQLPVMRAINRPSCYLMLVKIKAADHDLMAVGILIMNE